MRALGEETMSCLPVSLAMELMGCISGISPYGMTPEAHSWACSQYAAYMGYPICPDEKLEDAFPHSECLVEDQVKFINYCHFGEFGESPFWDSLCWLAQKDPAYWQTAINTPPCMGVSAPYPKDEYVPGGGGGAQEPPPVRESNMMTYALYGGAALVLIGGGIFFATRRKR